MKCGVADVGSNTIRLSVYEYGENGVKLLFNKKEMAGLGSYVQDGVLSESGILTVCRTLSGFRALLGNFEIADFYVFGTASLRNIANTEEAVDTIREKTGLGVEVLTGAEEAEFSFLGASMGGGAPSGLLADIGGGSTELVAYANGAISSECSLPIGSLSLYSKFVDGLFPTQAERRFMRDLAEAELERSKMSAVKFKRLTGVGGTIRAAAKLCNDLAAADPDNRIIPAEDIHGLYKRLEKGDKDALRQILRSTPDRVHTILPGLVILNAVVEGCGVETVGVSTCGVREGYLLRRVFSNAADPSISISGISPNLLG